MAVNTRADGSERLMNAAMKSTMKVTPFRNTWKTDNFKEYYDGYLPMMSNPFFSPIDDRFEWRLKMKIWKKVNDMPSNRKKYLGVEVLRHTFIDREGVDLKVKVSCYIIDALGNRRFQNSSLLNDRGANYVERRQKATKFDDLVEIEELFKLPELLPNGVLTIQCEITHLQEVETQTLSSLEPGPESLPFFAEGEILYESQDFSDVTLVCGSGRGRRAREFKAHKCILTTASPVFRSMFTLDMKEKRENRAEIRDVEPDVLDEMLRFVYTGKAPNLSKMAIKLLEVSDKYELLKLKQICEHHLATNLTIREATNVLVLAENHSADGLKKIVSEFIAENYNEVSATPEWKSVAESNQPLVIRNVMPFLGSKKS